MGNRVNNQNLKRNYSEGPGWSWFHLHAEWILSHLMRNGLFRRMAGKKPIFQIGQKAEAEKTIMSIYY